MSSVEFDEDKFGKPPTPPVVSPTYSPNIPNATFGNPGPRPGTPRMAAWLMRKGIRSEHAAQAVLIGVVVFNIIVTIIIIKFVI